MRELSKEEQELIYGGTETRDFDSISVWAPSYDGSFGDFDYSYSFFDYTLYDSFFDGQQDSGGGGSPAPICESQDAADVETYLDQLAAKLSRDIKAKPDDDKKEYLSLLYRDSMGTIKTTSLSASSSTGGQATLSLKSLGIGPTQILGFVHNHPYHPYGESTNSALLNRNPSHNDWETAEKMVTDGALASKLRLYLVDTAGTMRQFNYADRAKYDPPAVNTKPGSTASTTLVPAACS